jgi:hypothetical protein
MAAKTEIPASAPRGGPYYLLPTSPYRSSKSAIERKLNRKVDTVNGEKA